MCAFRDMLVGALISVYRLSDICMCLNLTSIRTSFFRPSICFWFSLRSCSIWARRSSISERAPCRDCLVTSCSAFSLLISPVRFSSCKHMSIKFECVHELTRQVIADYQLVWNAWQNTT